MNIWIPVLIFLLIFQVNAYPEQIILKNGDRLTGEIIEENNNSVSIKTEAMGVVSIGRDFIDRIVDPGVKLVEPSGRVEEVIWEKKISVGYNKSSGNTQTSQLAMNLFMNRNRKHVDEITLKGDVYYSSSNKKMDAQKWFVSGRYAFSFGKNKKWYNFYKLETDHDRFADVDYRVVPGAGPSHGQQLHLLSQRRVL